MTSPPRRDREVRYRHRRCPSAVRYALKMSLPAYQGNELMTVPSSWIWLRDYINRNSRNFPSIGSEALRETTKREQIY